MKGASEKGKSKGKMGKSKAKSKAKSKGKTVKKSSSTCLDVWSCGSSTAMNVQLENTRKKLEQIEAPGTVMNNIMGRVPEICDTMLLELRKDGQKCPDVIFLSELLKNEEKKQDRAFPPAIKCSNSGVNYTKDATEAGNRAVHKIAAYTRDGSDMKFQVQDTKWKDPNFDNWEHVLLVTETGSGKKVAGVHLTSANVKKGFEIWKKAMDNLKTQCKDQKISLIIGDFNFDVLFTAFYMGDRMEGWPGRFIGKKKVTLPSNSADDSLFMGITYSLDILGEKKVTECLLLQRSIKGEYYSDHPPIYARFIK